MARYKPITVRLIRMLCAGRGKTRMIRPRGDAESERSFRFAGKHRKPGGPLRQVGVQLEGDFLAVDGKATGHPADKATSHNRATDNSFLIIYVFIYLNCHQSRRTSPLALSKQI